MIEESELGSAEYKRFLAEARGKPPRFLVIVRDANDKTLDQYDLSLPAPGAPGFYGQTTSFTGFQMRELARTNSSRAVKRCSFTEWPWAQYSKLVRPTCKSVKDIWDLYRKIGYDYKTQRYV
jgi:hypothetical protein